jgi:hypothetical protein
MTTDEAKTKAIERIDELAAKMSRAEYREFVEKLHTHLIFRLDAIEEEEEED